VAVPSSRQPSVAPWRENRRNVPRLDPKSGATTSTSCRQSGAGKPVAAPVAAAGAEDAAGHVAAFAGVATAGGVWGDRGERGAAAWDASSRTKAELSSRR